MEQFGIEWVFWLGAGTAFSGVLVFSGILFTRYQGDALSEW